MCTHCRPQDATAAFQRVIASRLMAALIPALLLLGTPGRPAAAQTAFQVSFNDPGGTYAPYYGAISADALAAGADWARYLLSPVPDTIDIQFDFLPGLPTAQGASATSAFVGTAGGLNVYEQGAAAEARTGMDPNGAAPDVRIDIGTQYLTDALWFDPDPTTRTAAVPADRVDAYSVFLHELGHAFAFNGWRDGITGALPGDYESTFDANVVADNGILYFEGPQAESVYGGPVPLTYGDYGHVGNSAPRPGADLLPDLMNGVVFSQGTRYDISALDLAIAADSGVALARGGPQAAVPEPSAITLVACGLLPVLAMAVRPRRLSPRPTPERHP